MVLLHSYSAAAMLQNNAARMDDLLAGWLVD